VVRAPPITYEVLDEEEVPSEVREQLYSI
jgi:hypothetical protein